MTKDGQIIIIEDDADDGAMLKEVIEELGYKNEVIILPDSTHVMEFLKKPGIAPFLIFSDINMPKMSGYELRDLVLADPDLHDKTVPYIFFSTSSDPETIKMAYKKAAQGFFTKMNDYEEYQDVIKKIIEYWRAAKVPDKQTA